MTYNPIKTGILRRTRVKKIRRNEARERLTPKPRRETAVNSAAKTKSSGVTTEDRLSQLPDKILLSILEIFIF